MAQPKANIYFDRGHQKRTALTFLHVQFNMIAQLHLPRQKSTRIFWPTLGLFRVDPAA